LRKALGFLAYNAKVKERGKRKKKRRDH